MENLRKYGNPPYQVTVIHGGPGASGSMAPVAKELSLKCGVLEPLQTAVSIDGQIQELYRTLEQNSNPPVTLIGWSWGAWLSFLFASTYQPFVKKLILIGSGPFKQKYVQQILQTRLSRLTEEQKQEYHEVSQSLDDPGIKDKDYIFKRLGGLFDNADAYSPIELEDEATEVQYEIFRSVWEEASELRRNGRLLKRAQDIQCPVTAIHGDYDPHPYEGVERPLSGKVRKFKFVLLRNCGHKPWIERDARSRFYCLLKKEL